MAIKISADNLTAIKVGFGDIQAVYVGEVQVWPDYENLQEH